MSGSHLDVFFGKMSFHVLIGIYISSLKKCLFKLFDHFFFFKILFIFYVGGAAPKQGEQQAEGEGRSRFPTEQGARCGT